MSKTSRLRNVFGALILTISMLSSGTWAIAGTTGGLSGVVVDTLTNAPVSGVLVKASAPSQTATATTDAQGRFNFLSLAPDTYTVGAVKSGYDEASVSGINVFADSVETLTVTLRKSLTVIASVRSAASSSLVKSGTTSDVYSVNAATQDKISALGGGGNLNSAYASVASVPGAVMPLNQAGYFQTVHIRGGDYDQVGYEFDGVPVNRSFDNYPSGQLSSLGMSELQVYTGATPANAEGEGLAGYINQVIKTGTYPGFGDATLGIGSPAFYHKASIEAGGASPDRNFSYYVGVGGYNQDFRYVDQKNAAGYSNPYSGLGTVISEGGPATSCDPSVDPTAVNYTSCYANGVAGPGGYGLGPYNFTLPSSIFDRDVVVNLHFGLPHHNDSGRDDIQVLWDSGMLLNGFYESANDAGGAAALGGPVTYTDSFQWTGPVGTLLPANYTQYLQPYLFPDSPSHPAASFTGNGTLVNPAQRDAIFNNQEIVKLQYQKNFGSNAYLRAYGYTYYSNWEQTGPVCAYLSFGCFVSPDYELTSHTRGASLSFADQISSQHLITLEGNYTTANSIRDNNTQMYNTGGSRSMATVLVSSANPTSGLCYNTANTATPVACNRGSATYLNWACLGNPSAFAPGVQAGECNDNAPGDQPAAVGALSCGGAPCAYLVDENSQWATYNTVVPKFSSLSIQDEWRPSSKWLFNIGLRDDRYEFDGSNTNEGPARQFWFNAFNMDNCVGPDGFTLVSATTPGTCPAGDTPAHLTNASAQVLNYNVVEPRLSGTFTMNPDTVFRFSAGKYVEAPNTAYEQYNTLQEDLADYLGSNFYKYGFTTPGHHVYPPTSDNFDFSWEQRLRGTDVSFKLTPFYRHTDNQIQNFFLDQATGFISGLNVGKQTSEGLEFQLTKGDFNANGLSGLLSLTYTHTISIMERSRTAPRSFRRSTTTFKRTMRTRRIAQAIHPMRAAEAQLPALPHLHATTTPARPLRARVRPSQIRTGMPRFRVCSRRARATRCTTFSPAA